MTNENKLAAMDAVGELPDFGNLLLRESGYPHLDDTPKQSQSDAWNEAWTKPDHPCLCKTRVSETDFRDYYNYWNGKYFGLTATTKEVAMDNKDIPTTAQFIQWREVQP